MDINQNIATLFEQLDRFFKTETVFGEAMQVGNVSLIPVISISFGAGTGAGHGRDAKSSDGSGGGGAGGKITPTAVIVVRNEAVSVLPLSNRGYVDKIVEMVPELIDRIPHKKPKE